MQISGTLKSLPLHLKYLVTAFLLVLSIGYFTGIRFVDHTTAQTPFGIQENYLGNESDEDATEMKFKKSKQEMLNIVHTHILSMAMIFLLTGVLVAMTNLKIGFKKILMIEPFVSILGTFGGIYLLWSGILWMKYVIMISGILMTLAFAASVVTVMISTWYVKK
ncbi:hypothetical protein [Psychroflexus aestuariivivens]|uniref:hypothetical protein n=1 Tax=Psychroflexus aestuariivivens TaxID=1795040 RepID=UPI000FD970EA|nr:hypothetical protein [Psychroflexus aestuariivivens]